PGAKAHKQAQNEGYRETNDWTQYMRYWRKRESDRAARIDRAAAAKYYERHRDEVLARRRDRRRPRTASRTPCSQ
ncbi:MAG: hypothetical protein QME96_15095, partial [Myxococcota bacterium]|nr:hypothetical protein [Myxococcota bacterium]